MENLDTLTRKVGTVQSTLYVIRQLLVGKDAKNGEKIAEDKGKYTIVLRGDKDDNDEGNKGSDYLLRSY